MRSIISATRLCSMQATVDFGDARTASALLDAGADWRTADKGGKNAWAHSSNFPYIRTVLKSLERGNRTQISIPEWPTCNSDGANIGPFFVFALADPSANVN